MRKKKVCSLCGLGPATVEQHNGDGTVTLFCHSCTREMGGELGKALTEGWVETHCPVHNRKLQRKVHNNATYEIVCPVKGCPRTSGPMELDPRGWGGS